MGRGGGVGLHRTGEERRTEGTSPEVLKKDGAVLPLGERGLELLFKPQWGPAARGHVPARKKENPF